MSAEPPQGDWMRNRTLHHFPHEELAHRFGWAAFAMLVLMMVVVVTMLVIENDDASVWIGAMAFLAGILAHGFGIFSQVLSGGRCWIGAVSMALVWVGLFIALVVAL
jgi:hypothetical protein